MTSYVIDTIDIGQKQSGTGFNINDCWIGCLLLSGLAEKYDYGDWVLDMETDTGNHEVSGAFASSY